MNRTHRWMCLSALVSLSACAGATHVALPRDQATFAKVDAREKGIRYYESSLYLIVHADGKGGVKSEFRHLPDPSKPMTMRPHAFLATLKGVFEFENGVLTKSVADADETIIPKAIVSAAKDLLNAVIAKATESAGSAATPPIQLYKVITNEGKIEFRKASFEMASEDDE